MGVGYLFIDFWFFSRYMIFNGDPAGAIKRRGDRKVAHGAIGG